MLIVVITDSYFFSGSQNIIINMIKSKKLNQKYKLKFIVPKSEIYERQFKKRLSNSYVDYIRIIMPACSHLGQYFSTKRHLIFLNNIVYFLARGLQGLYVFLIYDCFRVWFLIKKYKPDFLYINNSGYPASDFCRAAALIASISSTKFFFHINNIAISINQTRWFKRPFEKLIDRIIDRHVTKFITGSKFAGDKLNKNRGFAKEKIINIYNTYTNRKPTAKKRELRKKGLIKSHTLVFGIVGLFHPRKGHKVLIDAIALLPQTLKKRDVLFLVEGSSGQAIKLINYVKEKKLTDKVVFVDKFDNIFNFYNMIDFLVLPSVCNEDFPNVIVESMSLGVPTVSSRISGIPEAIEDGYNGYLVEPGNASKLSVVLKKIILEPQISKVMGQNCIKLFKKRFNYDSIMNQYIKLFNKERSDR